jgi:two-component system, OmpR family, sensor histidine kinase KdpD
MQRADRLAPLAGSVAAVVLVTAAIALLRGGVPVLSLGSLYVLAVLPVAVLWGRIWAVLVAVASMLAFNFFFLEPRYTFRLSDRSNWLALAVYLATAIAVSELAARARRRAAEAEQREQEEALLGELSIALLQGESLVDELPRIGAATGSVIGVEGARIELGEASGQGIELRAGTRLVGRLVLPDGADPNRSAVGRFLPALASLLAVGLDREELERQARAAEGLRTSDAVKTAILRAVSHDLRSPLTAIRVAAESLTSSSLRLSEDDRAQQLETLSVETRRLDRLVSNLLDFSRLEAGAARPHAELVAVDELIGQALASVDADPVPIEVELPVEIPLVEVDSVQVERALVNLLANAQRFAPAETPVHVAVWAGDTEVVLRIANGGPAIEARQLDLVFEPFVRLAGDDDREGTGLGLAIARGFAEANGGRVWAESPAGGGAIFALAFPIAHVPAEATR